MTVDGDGLPVIEAELEQKRKSTSTSKWIAGSSPAMTAMEMDHQVKRGNDDGG